MNHLLHVYGHFSTMSALYIITLFVYPLHNFIKKTYAYAFSHSTI